MTVGHFLVVISPLISLAVGIWIIYPHIRLMWLKRKKAVLECELNLIDASLTHILIGRSHEKYKTIIDEITQERYERQFFRNMRKTVKQ